MTHLLISSLLNKNISHTPIWLMRQAGRYLPEYRQVREKAGSFMKLCTNPSLACEVTLQPIKRFNLDAAIVFSDILVIPDAMGLGLDFIENEGPKFKNPIKTIADIDNLQVTDIIENLSYVFDTIKNIKSELGNKKPLIGFSGSPFTLACYMLEGGSSNNYLKVKHWLVNQPQESHRLLAKITDAVILYLNAQIKAGVDVVMLFDSWGGILTTSLYLEFSLPYLQKILELLDKQENGLKTPSIVFTKGGGIWLDYMVQLPTTALGVDWTIDIGRAKQLIKKDMVLQGNLDPVILAVADKSVIKKEVAKIIGNYANANNGNISGHVFNLGHGVIPITNPDNVAYLVDIVHEISSRL
ncbi:MAG: uroporphyrinogen decarboxylase [Burkholderiales bacterium]|nr:uroporphyrinogen decarboxylase [Burkholderiales bacterium]